MKWKDILIEESIGVIVLFLVFRGALNYPTLKAFILAIIVSIIIYIVIFLIKRGISFFRK